MKIGILGTGGVGRTLAARLIESGHEVMIGTRNVADTLARSKPDHYGNPPFKAWQADNPRVKLGAFSEAATFGDVVFVTTLGMAAINAIDLAGTENLSGESVVDVSKPLDASEGMPPKFAAT